MMKSTQLLSTLAVMGLAASVTVGSMYVTVRAAAQQEAEIPPAPAVDVIVDQSGLTDVVAEVVQAMNAPLSPEEVIHDRSHDIVIDANGSFSGRLSMLAGSDISAAAAGAGVVVKVVQDGIATGEVETNSEGVFTFSGLKPGVAALLAYGEDSFLLYGIRLVAAADRIPANAKTDIASFLVRGVDVPTISAIISSELTDGDVRFNAESAAADAGFHLGVGDVSTSVVGHRVQLQKDGSLKGVVNLMDHRTGRMREILDLTVYFVNNGTVVAKADVENTGAFTVVGLNPGLYSVVGAGKDGAFAIGVEVLGAEFDAAADASSRNGYRTVAVMASLEFCAAAVGAGDFNLGNFAGLTGGAFGQSGAAPGSVAGVNPAGTPGAPGGGAGAGGGGGAAGGGGAGAGGGGGGGLGALLGAGIAGGIGYAAGQGNSSPASPGN